MVRENAAPRQEIAQPKREIAQLGQVLSDLSGKTGGNTHQPPSQDKFSKPNSLRVPSEKKVGGQPGHKGSRLEATDSPDEVVELPSASLSSACGSSSLPTVWRQRRQVFDLPPDFRLSVREYVSPRKVCEGCGAVCQGEFPANVKAPTPYGSCIMAPGVRLHEREGLAYARASALLRDMFGVASAPATLEAAGKRMEAAVSDFHASVKTALRQENVVCCDETGLRVGGRNFWAHVFCTGAYTYMSLSTQRGAEAIGAHLDGYSGTAVHDGWKSYWKFGCKHAVCNAHILRELKFLAEVRNRF